MDRIKLSSRSRLVNPSELSQDVQDAMNVVVIPFGTNFNRIQPRATEEQLKDVRWQLYLSVTEELGPDCPVEGRKNHKLWKKKLKEIDSLTTIELIEDYLEQEGYDSIEFLRFFGVKV